MLMPTIQTPDIPDIRLPLKFIFSGLFFFLAAQVTAVTTIPALLVGNTSSPEILATAHLLILGWGVMVAMGALYQLTQVILQVPIAHLRLAHLQYFIYLSGVLGLVFAFSFFSPALLLPFALLTVTGILLFSANLFYSTRKAKPSEIRTAVYASICALLLTVVLGLWMVVDFAFPHLGSWRLRFLHAHISLGIVGWFSLLIVAISYKLLPMLSLSHRYESPLSTWSIWLILVGNAFAAIGLLFPVIPMLARDGYLLVAAGFFCFTLQVQRILKHRMRKNLDVSLQATLSALPVTLSLLLTVLIIGWIRGNVSPIALVYAVLYGWISLSILGYLFKIIPFLWWTAKYSTRIGITPIPKLNEMINESRGKVLFVLLVTTFIATGIGFSLEFRPLLLPSLLATVPLSLWYLLEALLVLRR